MIDSKDVAAEGVRSMHTPDPKVQLREELARLLAARPPHSVINGSYQNVIDYKAARVAATKTLNGPKSSAVSLELAVRSMRAYATSQATLEPT